MTSRLAYVFLLLCTLPVMSAALAEDSKTALIVGNNSYAHVPLRNSVNDARSISQALTKLGFKVELLLDAPQNRIHTALERFARENEKRDAVSLLYFSGHGVQFRDRNWALGVDATPEVIEDKSVDIQAFLSKLKRSGATTIVILDACREYVPSESETRGLAPLDAPPGTLLAFSTAPGRFASDGNPNDRNGIYTKHLLRHLSSPGASIESIFKKVRIDVISETNGAQIPWENSSLTRDFYFNPAPPGYFSQAKPSSQSEVAKREQLVEAALKGNVQPVSRLESLYEKLARYRTSAGQGSQSGKDANAILGELTGLSFSDDELAVMSKGIVGVGAFFKPAPKYITEHFQIRDGGMLAGNVAHASIAYRAGLREGDIITHINGLPVANENQLQAVADALQPGELVYAITYRNGTKMTLSTSVERTSVDDLVWLAASEAMDKRNYSRTRELLDYLRSKMHVESFGLMANLDWNGLGIFFSDYASAFRNASVGAQLGSSRGAFWQMQGYLRGKGVLRNLGMANKLRNDMAQAGAPWAVAGLGIAYLQGQGIAKDYPKARVYLERAAFQGHPDGMLGMAMIHEEGLGTERNIPMAIEWYQRAADSGNDSVAKLAEVKLRAFR